MHIIYFFRKPRGGAFSIENLFHNVQAGLGSRATYTNYYLSLSSNGLINRFRLALEAYKYRGPINHVTGDVNFIAMLLPKHKTVLTIHDIESLSRKNILSNYLLKLFWLKLPVARVKYVTVVSDTTKKRLLEELPVEAEKVLVIPNAISATFKFVPKKQLSAKPVVLQIGTKYNKNLERIIEALQGIDCRFIIVGKLSDSQSQLLTRFEIVYSNYVDITEDELQTLYVAADVVTFVSLFEGFGMPILEAQATGRPVITSNCSAMPEVAGEGGALFVNPYEISEIRDAVLKLLNDNKVRETLISNGLGNCKRYSNEAIAQQYLALYQKISDE